MNTTVKLDAELVERAQALTGIKDHSTLVAKALELLVEQEADRSTTTFGRRPAIYHAPRRRHSDPHIYDTD